MSYLVGFITFYYPILLTFILVIFQAYFGKYGKLTYAIILPISFTILIKSLFWAHDFLVVLILGNFFFYLIAVVTYFTKLKF